MEGRPIGVNFLDPSQFSYFSRDVAIATNFVYNWTFSLGAEVSQDLLDQFSQYLHHMVGMELQMINPTFFSNILRDVVMATNFVAKLPTPLHLSLWHSETE